MMRVRRPARLRRLSAVGLAAIAKREGFEARAYKPVAAERFWTIGYGHYGPDVHPGQKISKARALLLLRRDVAAVEATVRRLVRASLTQGEFDALVSLCFNIGAGNFATSTVLRRLNAGDRRAAADAFEMWVKGADGRKLAGLESRRRAERWRFLNR